MRAALLSVVAALSLTSLICLAGWEGIFLHAPRPDLTKLQQHQGLKGSGIFILHVDKRTGAVTAVDIQRSTGSSLLDQISIETFRKWRGIPGTTAAKVRVPIVYSGEYPKR
jgi:TonB family protein